MNRRILNAWGKFRYKQVEMEPYRNLFLITTLIFFIFVHLIDNFIIFVLSVGIYIITLEVIAQLHQMNTVRINDFLRIQKHPTRKKDYYIYQKVDYSQLFKYSCHNLRELYFSEMPQVLSLLRPGTYRMVTQPLFTKELFRAKNVEVVYKKKAYKKKMDKLQQEVFLNRCKSCSNTDCPYRTSKTKKQFYYVEFKVLERCETLEVKLFDKGLI